MADDLAENIRARNQQMEAELQSLQERVDGLRVSYDRYFMGLERIPPLRDRDSLERDMRNTSLRKSHKTSIKFRYNNVRSRFTTYRRHWDRIMRLIEEGKFKREKSSLRNMHKVGGPPAPAGADAAGPGGGAPKEPGMREVYDSWRQAQKGLGKNTKVDFDRFREKLERQKQAQMEKYGWKDVGYSVRVKEGKVALVAKPVKE